MKRVLLFLGLFCSLSACYAEENVLQTIEIEPVKDTYNIVLVSDKAVDVKKTVQASNKIDLNLKDIRASKTLSTVYNNVANVDTVMVEQQGNNLNIYFQADNAENATVTFDSLIAEPKASDKTKTMKLNNPIESYAPIYSEDSAAPKTSSMFNKLKNSALSDLKEGIDEDSTGDKLNKGITYGLIGLLVIAVSRLFKRREPDMKIGLAQQFQANQELARANLMNQSLQSGFHNGMAEKPFTTVNYGINAYKNESKNPYESEPVTYHNPRLRSMAAANQAVSNIPASRPMQTVTQTVTQPIQKKMTTPVNTAPVNQSNPNVDNLKFLESMTAIYEKSGRHDLARGLRASLSKNNTQV